MGLEKKVTDSKWHKHRPVCITLSNVSHVHVSNRCKGLTPSNPLVGNGLQDMRFRHTHTYCMSTERSLSLSLHICLFTSTPQQLHLSYFLFPPSCSISLCWSSATGRSMSVMTSVSGAFQETLTAVNGGDPLHRNPGEANLSHFPRWMEQVQGERKTDSTFYTTFTQIWPLVHFVCIIIIYCYMFLCAQKFAHDHLNDVNVNIYYLWLHK